MYVRLNSSIYLYIGFFALTFSNSQFLINLHLNEIVAYLGLFSIIVVEIYSNLKKKAVFQNFFVTCMMFLLLSLGIFLQDMNLETKLIQSLSVLIISIVATYSENVFKNLKDLKNISNSILAALLVSTILSLVIGESLKTDAYSGLLYAFGFNGGMQHKNFCAFATLAAFIGDYVYYNKHDCKLHIKLIVEVFIILISNSNGSLICLLAFLFFYHCIPMIDSLRLSKDKLIFVIIIIFLLIFCWLFFVNVILKVSTYQYRIRGLMNYINYYSNDYFHVIFGDAAMAFTNYADGMDYSTKVRSVIGWDGTLEIAWLNVLIKSGMLGIFSYILYFNFLRGKIRNIFRKKKYIIYSLILTLLTSTFVENFITNTKLVFGIYCYIVILGLVGLFKKD